METFWGLILVLFFATNSLDIAESVQLEELEELPLQTFDELFVDEWWDKDEAEDLLRPPTNFGQNVHHQIDRQNTQIGQVEPNSNDRNSPLKEADHSGQIAPNSTDLNPPLTEFDHSGQIEPNSTDQNPPNEITSNRNIEENERKRKIINKFHATRNEFKQKGNFSAKEWNQIEDKIAKHLKVCRKKIYKWKKEFGLSRKVSYENEERKNLVEKFDQMKAELMRAGFKNSYNHENDETVAKELGITDRTISNWKRKLGQSKPNHIYSHSEQKEFMRRYYEIKGQTPKISDGDIAKMLNIGRATLYKWKNQFKRQQLHPNSVDGNVQEIENSNSRSI